MKYVQLDISGLVVLAAELYGGGSIPADAIVFPNEELPTDQILQYAYDKETGDFVHVGLQPSSIHHFDPLSMSWAVSVDDMKGAQSEVINLACQSEIYAGFDSDALGTTHHYPAKSQDQANLVASVTASLLPGLSPTWTTPFWCSDELGVWDYTPHTAAQIQQVGTDGKTAILAALGKNEYLQRQIQAATSLEEVQGVVW